MKIKHLRNFWVLFIQSLIWFTEKITFYPKLRLPYKELSLSPAIGGALVFDVGANKGQSIKFFSDIFPGVRI